MRVEVRNGQVDRALKILKKKMFDDGTIREVMERRFYEKPSETRKRRKKEAINRRKKSQEREARAYAAAKLRHR